MFDITEELKKLPDKPGVYIMRDSYNNILYIGKASVLKNRVRQYFQSSSNLSPRIRTMVSKISRFEYIVTTTELEALVLECNLIKEHKPRFNVLLKDDKSYPYIKVTTNEEYPRIYITRKVLKDEAKYYGPYTDVSAVKDTLAFLKKIFPLRLCDKVLPRDIGKQRPCLNYHISQCLAPCQGEVNAKDYRQMIKEVCDFLGGKQGEVIGKLQEDMEHAAENMEFEKARVFRDRILAAQKLAQKQKVTESGDNQIDIDIIGLARGTNDACVQVFFVRNGKLVGRENFMFRGMVDVEDTEIITSFLKQFYAWTQYIPKQILLGTPIEEDKIIEEWLSEKIQSKVEIRVPQKGDKRNLLEMAQRNAEIELQRHGLGYEVALSQLKDILGLDAPLKRIEAFDISNLSGTSVVGSMVVFDGKLDKRQYKRYKINTIVGQNDIGCMNEVVGRRLRRAINSELNGQDEGRFGRLPELLLVDGGYGQVSAALEAAKTLGLCIPIAGMVKDKKHRTKALVLEDGTEVELKKYPKVLKLISEIQEEVHRFAIDYHRKTRGKESMRSVLDEIKGVGSLRKRELFKHFGSMESIKEASIEQLRRVKGMNNKIAEAVYDFFHNA